jgi:hypothetical protein
VRENLKPLSFCTWLTSLSMISSSIYLVLLSLAPLPQGGLKLHAVFLWCMLLLLFCCPANLFHGSWSSFLPFSLQNSQSLVIWLLSFIESEFWVDTSNTPSYLLFPLFILLDFSLITTRNYINHEDSMWWITIKFLLVMILLPILRQYQS